MMELITDNLPHDTLAPPTREIIEQIRQRQLEAIQTLRRRLLGRNLDKNAA